MAVRTTYEPHEVAAMRAHFAGISPNPCPVCGATDWIVNGIITELTLNAGDKIMPLLAIRCQRCHFVRHFAWLAILNAHFPDFPAPTGEGGT